MSLDDVNGYQNLSKWSEEEWQTKDGSGEAKQKDGSRKRYLPKKSMGVDGREGKEGNGC